MKNITCKLVKYVIACYLLLVILNMTACREKINHGFNLSFENVDSSGYPSGWRFSMPSTGYLVKRDTQIFQDKNASISIEHLYGSNGGGACTYEVSVPLSGTDIELTGYVKTKDVQGGFAGLWMRIEDSDQKILSFSNMRDSAIVGTKDWRRYTIKMTLDSKADKIYFGGLLVGSGKIWIDNLHLTVDGHNIESLPLRKQKNADLDKSFIRSSGVSHIILDAPRIRNLTNLGMIWGFLKYYHSRVASGNVNWDAELFRILPKILPCKSVDEANVVLEKWLNTLGEPTLSPNPDTVGSNHIRMDANYGFLFSPNNLSAHLIDKLKRWRDHHLVIEDHYYLSIASGVGNPIFRHEFSPSGDLYPDEGYRLLALFRYWNIVNYFYPYRYNIEGNWNEMLTEFIPKVLNAGDKVEYAKVCLELICKINDGHAVLTGNSSLDSAMGHFTAPFEANFIGNELVVTKLLGGDSINNSKLNVGDLIKSIDGRGVSTLIKQYIRLTPGANLQNRMFKLASNPGWILRSGSQSMNLIVLRKNKEVHTTVRRIPLITYYSNYWIYSKDEQNKRGYYLINSNIGYIYPAALKDKDIGTIKEMFKFTKGMIIDLRCYPRTFMPYEYGKWLKQISSPFAIFSKAWLTRPGVFIYGNTARNGLVDTSYTNGKVDFISTYRGKLIVLVNELTISQAEFTTMALQSIPGTIVLGSQTAGSDGDVSRIVLPGDINTMISGLGVYYPDSSETQCVGVKINQIVKPTIVGISEKRDELLERAVKFF
ncbi:hypothetical protein HGH93_02395 [Chitinophaga polysaccharea]|uniref:S41 family peptidase n=1 Tax=Chitinophaga polysaccharea TaxID=1293035 RepID=UPI001455DB1E|nr:S41 family peptidase [Chitinophaga polysaccharea]NLR56934.1 hypothetical protein [Chitinophaga polysaccharea]